MITISVLLALATTASDECPYVAAAKAILSSVSKGLRSYLDSRGQPAEEDGDRDIVSDMGLKNIGNMD